MVQKRGSHVCTVVNDDIYAIGGWDAQDYLAIVEVYDVRQNAWREVAPMCTTRAYGAAATVNGAVYTLGGMLNHVRPLLSRHAFNNHNMLKHDACRPLSTLFKSPWRMPVCMAGYYLLLC